MFGRRRASRITAEPSTASWMISLAASSGMRPPGGFAPACASARRVDASNTICGPPGLGAAGCSPDRSVHVGALVGLHLACALVDRLRLRCACREVWALLDESCDCLGNRLVVGKLVEVEEA